MDMKPLQAPVSTCAQVSFHVKHFGTIGAKNLTRAKTAVLLQPCKIDQFFGRIPEARRRRGDSLAGLREVITMQSPLTESSLSRGMPAAWFCPSPPFDNTVVANREMFRTGLVQQGSPVISMTYFWCKNPDGVDGPRSPASMCHYVVVGERHN
jgi:hypothetical protein